MSAIASAPLRSAAALGAILAAGVLFASPSIAEERHHHEERFRTPHMVYDNRYHHGHYYPSVGYSVNVLPPGYVSIGYASRHYFYHGGVWYQPGLGGYVVVRAPVGVMVPVLPPAYSTVWMAGRPYYYANDVYYVQAQGGYAVAAPPPGIEQGTVMTAPAAPPAPAAAPPGAAPGAAQQAAPGMWYYCESSKTYYPYVSECREGWRQVPAAPPGAR